MPERAEKFAKKQVLAGYRVVLAVLSGYKIQGSFQGRNMRLRY